MTQTSTTVAEALTEDEFGRVVEKAVEEVQKSLAKVRVAGVDLDDDTLRGSAAEAVSSALSMPLMDVLGKAWSGMKSVRALTGPNGPVDGKDNVVGLVEHTVSARHKPSFQVVLGDVQTVATIEMPVAVYLKVAGGAITVRDREITRIAALGATPKVTVHVEAFEVVSREMPLMEFKDPIWEKTAAPQI